MEPPQQFHLPKSCRSPDKVISQLVDLDFIYVYDSEKQQ